MDSAREGEKGGGGAREVRGGQTVMEKTASCGEESNKRRGKVGESEEKERRRVEGGGEGRMHGEVDGWMAHGKHRESRAE